MIYVTVGTMYRDFPRLIRKVDEIAAGGAEPFVVQTGLGKTLPRHCEHFAFKPREEVLALQREARLIICHAGIGAVLDALHAGRPFAVVPRLKRFGEHNSDHQLDLARAVQRRRWGATVLDIGELEGICANPPDPPVSYRPDKARLVRAVRTFIDDAAGEKWS